MLQKGWHLGEYNMWEKRTVWELGTRVPFMVHVPWLPQSHGRHTAGLTELVSQPAPAWPCVWYQIHNSQYQHVSYCVKQQKTIDCGELLRRWMCTRRWWTCWGSHCRQPIPSR